MTASVIFDCDGVLVDTEPIGNRVLAVLLTEHGLPTTTEEAMDVYKGLSMPSCIALSQERLGAPLPADFATRYYAAVEEEFARGLDPIPGIHDALDRIARPACVASSGPHRKMRITLGMAGLYDRFEGAIFSAREVRHGKPAPDLFLYAADRMGFDPASTAVVEDSVPGVQAGVSAGMRVLGFARGTDSDRFEAAGAEVFGDMADLPGLLGDRA